MIFEKMYIDKRLIRTLDYLDPTSSDNLLFRKLCETLPSANSNFVKLQSNAMCKYVIGKTDTTALSYGYNESEISYYLIGARSFFAVDLSSVGLPSHTETDLVGIKLGLTNNTIMYKYFFNEIPSSFPIIDNTSTKFSGILLDSNKNISPQNRLDIYFTEYSATDVTQFCSTYQLLDPIPDELFSTNSMIGVTYDIVTKLPTKIKYYQFE